MSSDQIVTEAQRDYRLLSVVIPCFNEQDNLVPVVEAIRKHTEGFSGKLKIVLVDDGSTDATWKRISDLATGQEDIKALKFSRNFGKEAAIAAGLSKAEGDIVILMDADLQHPPELIPRLIERWQQGDVEIVEGVKRSRGEESKIKEMLSRFFYFTFGKLAGLNVQNASDFKLLTRKAIDAWGDLPERNLFFRGMSVWIGYPRAEIYFSVPERLHGESGWSYLQLTKLALSALTAYSSAPLRLVALIGILFGVFAAILIVETLFNYFMGQAVSGFTTVIILLLIVGAAILFGLAIVGEYIARIYDEIKGRPRYLIEKTLGDE